MPPSSSAAPAPAAAPAAGRPRRIVICWTGISGYLAACWRALAAQPGVDLRILSFVDGPATNAPFDEAMLHGLPFQRLDRSRWDDREHVASLVTAHEPDVVVVCGWYCPAFVALAFHPSLSGARFAMGMDTNRKDTWRQHLARLKIGRFLDRLDHVFVGGERSWQLARLLRVPESRIHRGLYGFDQQRFDEAHEQRIRRPEGWPRRFLFVGRYVPDKGVATLLAAYAQYRRRASDPWPLGCCGKGPMADDIRAAEGAEDLGFIQPVDQPRAFADHGVFVLASRHEPWGVALAEAAGSGLPVICTESCSAAVEIVRPYYNGLTVATDDADQLAAALHWMHQHHDRLPAMGLAARHLARAFGADVWAEHWATTLR